MHDSFGSTLQRYLIASVAVLFATVARLALAPVLGELLPFATFFLAILITATLAGRGPGLVATAMGGLAAVVFFLRSRGQFEIYSIATQAGLVLYLTIGVGIALLGGSMRSARRRAEANEAEAVEQRELFRTTLASIGDAVVVADDQGHVRFLNPVAEKLSGWPAKEAAGRPIGDVFRIIHEKTREPVDDPVGRVVQEGSIGVLSGRSLLVARDGTETPIEDSAGPIKDVSGKVIGVVMVFQNATDRRLHEVALLEGEERFRQMAESIYQLAWMAEPDGSIFWYNRRWYDYTGTDHEAMQGWGWRSVHDPEILPSVEAGWGNAIATGEPFDMVFPLRRADGEFRPFLTRVMPLKDDQGRVIRWFGTNTDISEERKLLRDRERAEELLRAAKEEAEEANQAKDRFLAILSHELRTPLNPILLAATSMLERPVPHDELRPTLEMIRQNVALQARLIDDLLDVMRIVRGKMPLHWEVRNAHDLIRQALRICEADLSAKQLRLNLDLAAESHHVKVDPARFQQVIWNLVKNAVKFTPAGGSIAIVTRDSPDAGSLIIEVSDDGIGIAPAILPIIFDPFQQGEKSITRKFGGLGLGLAICKGIVESHGGTLTAESEGEGRGTRFQIALEAVDRLTATDAKPVVDSLDARPRPPASLKILIVEDEPATRRLMARLLIGLGHEVTASGTVDEAAEASSATNFDLIVSDLGLPDGSGLDLMRRVVAERGAVPSIALTGYGMEEDIMRSREAGFTAHMTKPIDFTKLEAMIRQVAS